MGAPRPQPTLPKVGLGDHDLYADSDAGSIRNGSIRGAPSSRYQYPPPSNAGYSNAPSALARTAYPYNQSEPESLHHAGYAESVHSTDGFAGRGAPMPYDSSVSLVDQASGMRRAPSYKSDWDEGGYYGSAEKASAVAGYYSSEKDDGYAPSALAHSESYNGLYRSQPTAPPHTPAPDHYSAPSRQQLYERTARQQQSEDSNLAYGGGMSASESVPYGGWEESASRYHGGGGQDPYYPDQRGQEELQYQQQERRDDGNFAGRGAGGRR